MSNVYAYSFTFHYGDGLSSYSGYFFSTSPDVSTPAPVEDGYQRWGYYVVTSGGQLQPPYQGSPLVTAYVGGKSVNLDPGDPILSSNNVWIDAANFASQTALPLATQPTTTISPNGGDPVTIIAPSGTGGLGTESALISGPNGGSLNFSSQVFPSYLGYDVFYNYQAAQSSGWAWSGTAADNGLYHYYVSNNGPLQPVDEIDPARFLAHLTRRFGVGWRWDGSEIAKQT